MGRTRLNRRQFLKLAGVTGALAVPTVLGYELVQDAQGELPPSLSPYAPSEVMASWPAEPAAASPILLLINERSENPFGPYLGEILRAEGLNCIQVADLSRLENAPLDWYDIIVLAEGSLGTGQVERLEAYVAKGSRLVAMRPDVRLAPLLGVEPLGASTSEGYMQVDSTHAIGQGIATRALQYHGSADHYRLAGAESVAWLAGADDLPTTLPAVTLHRYGEGQAALWAFDLARSVAYTRQGNPAWANQERDGGFGIRAVDMFKDWVDLDRLLIPQADEQQRLLANLLVALSQGARPLPRIWYFPGAAESVFIATGDSHIPPASAIEEMLSLVEERGGNMSIYYSPPPSEDLRRAASRARFYASDLPVVGEVLRQRYLALTPFDVAKWRERGHEFTLHPYVGQEGTCAASTSRGLVTPDLETGWRRYWSEFTGLGYGPVSPTVRTHCILWTGWVESARLQASYGMRLNLDYYHWGPTFRNRTGNWVYGHFTGSGLPMRFVDEQGRIINLYQQLTQLTDDHLLGIQYGGTDWGGQAKLDAGAALEVSRDLLLRSLADYCAVTANFHPDLLYLDPMAVDEPSRDRAVRWYEGTLDQAAALGMPIWSALQWLRFTEARHDAGLEVVRWQPAEQRLSCELSPASASEVGLTSMVPLSHDGAQLSQVEVDGVSARHYERLVGGIAYACIPLDAGPHRIMGSYA